MSGWFADRAATKRFVLGDCRCPGRPHDEDYWDVRSDWSGSLMAEIKAAKGDERLQLLIVDWNLHNDEGKVPIEGEWLSRLYLEVLTRFNEWTTENVTLAPLPNESGAPSQNGSKASASPVTLTTQKSD